MSRKKIIDKEKNSSQVIEKKSFINILLTILVIVSLVTSGFLIYELFLLSTIETLIRYIVMGVLVLIDLILIIRLKMANHSRKHKKKTAFIIFMLLYSLICFGIAFVINFIYGQIDNLNKDKVIYSSSLLTMSNNKAKTIKDINNFEIGIIDDQFSPDGYIIPQEIIKEYKINDNNTLKDYDNYSTMLVDMYAGELDAIFISSNYVDMFSNITGYEDISTDTRVIISKEKEMKKAATSDIEVASINKSVTEPFTILLMGIDSTEEVLEKNAIANGDTLILITFNPKTLNATMVSIPRDSYIPIACWANKDENKITHAAGYGNDCMINTIQNYFGVTIDYYAKLNFKGLVHLVDAVGGVEVDVPQKLCTDDSSRFDEVCINPGRQVLNGEQALVFARNRKALVNGDFGRAKHQQEIIMALINKIKTVNKVSQFKNILNAFSNCLDTNLTSKQILEFYNVGKDIVKRSFSSEEAELINIQQLYLDGSSQIIYDERMRLALYNYIPNTNSRKDIVQAMKENLELADHKPIKSFNFSINVPYEKEVIGEGPYRTGYGIYTLLPNFIGMSEAQASNKASSLGITVKFVGASGTVIDQSYPERKRVDKIKDTLVLTLSGSIKDDEKDEKDEKDENNEKDENSENDGSDDNENEGSTEIINPTPSASPNEEDSSTDEDA